ncbi:MAG: hypothetical protein AB8H12_08035 [Lewinella sp.]
MNKLEKQLRASRGREISGLTPPPGGLEAINAKIAADPVGEQAPVDQSATPSWVKWSGGGIGAVLLIAAAVFMPPGVNVAEEQEMLEASREMLAIRKVTAVEERGMTSEIKEEAMKDVEIVQESELIDSDIGEKSGQIIKEIDQTKFIEQGGNKDIRKTEAAQEKTNLSGEQLSGEAAADSSETLRNPVAPEPIPQVLGSKEPDGRKSVEFDTSKIRMAASLEKPHNFVDKRQEYLPLKLSSPLNGLSVRSGEWPAAPLQVMRQKQGFFKRRRIKTRPEWQLYASVSGFVGEDYDGTFAFNVDPAGSSGIIFVRPSGGLIHVEPDAVRVRSNRLEQIYLRAGINRQTSSGFLFRSSIGLFQSKSFQIGVEGELMIDEVEVKTNKNETIIPVEFGVQYTFLRRRRIKPYAGVSLVGYLNYLGVDEAYFTEGATAEEGLVSRFSSQEFISLAPDLGLTLGLQYQLTSRISAGAFLWGNMGGNFYAQAPFGVEVRYSLK